jgi:hypothetical protein
MADGSGLSQRELETAQALYIQPAAPEGIDYTQNTRGLSMSDVNLASQSLQTAMPAPVPAQTQVIQPMPQTPSADYTFGLGSVSADLSGERSVDITDQTQGPTVQPQPAIFGL